MDKAEEIKEIRRKYSFKLDTIGPALAYIVSEYEGVKYLYTSVRTYSLDINEEDEETKVNGPYYNMAIVQEEFMNCDFRTGNDNEIWKMKKLALIFKNNEKNKNSSVLPSIQDRYLRIFQKSPFPYLQDFIEVLASERENGKEITQESAFSLALNYCAFLNGLLDKDSKQKTYTFNYNNNNKNSIA